MSPADFLTRWQASGGAERANYGLFLHDLTTLLGVAPPDAVTDDPARDTYVLEKPVTFNDGAGKKSTGRIDLYKRGCFVLETKQGVDNFAGSTPYLETRDARRETRDARRETRDARRPN